MISSESSDSGPLPASFTAVTRQVYVAPSVRPVTIALVVVEFPVARAPPLKLSHTALYMATIPEAAEYETTTDAGEHLWYTSSCKLGVPVCSGHLLQATD